jgi:hypothetical protein
MMADDAAAIDNPTPAPVRDLTAEEVGLSLGLKRRIIELAVAEGCPHTRERRAGKRNTLWFNTEEVREWRRLQGLDADRHELFNAAAPPAPPTETGEPAHGADRGALPGPGAAAPHAHAAGSDDAIIEDLRHELDELRGRFRLERQKDQLSSAAINQLAGALKNIETTLSKREAALRDAEERDGLVMQRSAVTRLLVELAGVFASMLEALPMTLPSVVRLAVLEAKARPEEADTFDRVAGVAIRDRLTAEREALARQIDQAAAELEVERPPAALKLGGKERAA